MLFDLQVSLYAPSRATFSRKTGADGGQPNAASQQQRQQHGGAAKVFGPFGKRVPLQSDAVNGRLDAAVEQLGHHDDEARASEQGGFHPVAAQPEGGRNERKAQHRFLPESRFMPGGAQARQRVAEGMPQARQTGAFGRQAAGNIRSALGRL